MTYAVIYDVRLLNGEDSEQYYGYFDTAEDAERMFNNAFCDDLTVHNAYVVELGKQIKAETIIPIGED